MDSLEDRVHAVVPLLGGYQDIPVWGSDRIAYLTTAAVFLNPASEILSAC
jgi:hypothetical protein